jgi:pyruvate dehydrogenase (quinone)
MAITVADLLVERLIDWGVDTIFSLPGDGINGIYEALRTRQDRIKLILVRHEESAAFAACGYAKFTRRLGVCLATSGPGGIHLLNGLYDAKCDGQPVLAITGHTFHDLIGTHYQQDVDLNKLFGDVAAYSERVMSAAHVGNVIDSAVKTAIARRTVAHVTIPKDIQDWTMDDERSKANIPQHSGDLYSDPLPLPSQRLLDKAAAVIHSGQKIAILAGRGCLGAKSEILALAELLGAPIVKPLLGKGLVPDDHPLTTGGIGLLGTAPSQEVLEECREQLPLSRVLPETRPGSGRTNRPRCRPDRITLSSGSRPCGALLGCAARPAALAPTQTGPPLPGGRSREDAAME